MLRLVKDIPADARHALEALLGRPLQDTDAVDIHIYPPQKAPEGAERDHRARQLLDSADRIAARMQHVSEAERDAALDEALDYVRHHGE